ncbi:hypothetical protein JOL62DRAFT_176994 [Phyllosticta paracitricarpa]|uniref:Uncharacterized protein n=2 Tax=Phyllosticta TaxID=121621 RepID=A0ABR1MP04_9PEZI
MQHFILLAQPRLFRGWWDLIKTHSFRRRGSDVPLTSLLPSNAPNQRDSATSAPRSPTPNNGGMGGNGGKDLGTPTAASPASKTGANINATDKTPPQPTNSATTTPTSATQKSLLSANTPTTPKTPATSLNLSSRPSFFSRRASSHTRSPSRGGAIARSLANTPTHAHDGYDEFDSDDVYGPDSGHAPPRTISHPYGFALPSERASTVTDPAERRRLARSGDIVDFDFQQYDHDVRNSRSSAGSFDEAARGNLRDSGSSFGTQGIGLGVALPVGGLGTGPWNTPAAAHTAGRGLAEDEGRGVTSPVSNPLPLSNHPEYYAGFSSATDNWDNRRPVTPPPPPLPLNFSRRGRGNGAGGAGRGAGGPGLANKSNVPGSGGMHPTAAGQRKASWAGSSGAVSSVGSSVGIGGNSTMERDSMGASTGRSVSPFTTGDWERVDPHHVAARTDHGVQVSDYASLEVQQQQQHHRRPPSLSHALKPTTPPPSTGLPCLPGSSSPSQSPLPSAAPRTPASLTSLATPLKAPYQQPPCAPDSHNAHPTISPFSFQAHQPQHLFTPPDSSSPSSTKVAPASALSTASTGSASSSLPPTPTPAPKARGGGATSATVPHLSTGTSPSSPKIIKLGRSATTAALPPPGSTSGNGGSGVANPHRLPSWARDTASTLGFKLARSTEDEKEQQQQQQKQQPGFTSPQSVRDAVRHPGRGRGGLGMHPVSPESPEVLEEEEDEYEAIANAAAEANRRVVAAGPNNNNNNNKAAVGNERAGGEGDREGEGEAKGGSSSSSSSSAWRSSRFSGSSTSDGGGYVDAVADPPPGDAGAPNNKGNSGGSGSGSGSGSGFLGVGSRRWSGGSWVNGKRRSGQSVFSSLSGISNASASASATGNYGGGGAAEGGVRKRSV